MLSAAPAAVRPSGLVAQAMSALGNPARGGPVALPGLTTRSRAYSERCGVALGVVVRSAGGLEDGPRAEAWRNTAPADQIRALARWWLVDERAPESVPAWFRRLLWEVLRALEAATWYDLGSLARRLAWLAAESSQAIRHRDLETATEVLGWIGVVALGEDASKHVMAMQLGEYGLHAVTPE